MIICSHIQYRENTVPRDCLDW